MLIKVSDRDVNIHEVTVGEVREYLQAEETGNISIDPVTDLMFEDLSLRDLVFMTDITLADMDDMKPSQIQELIDACKGLNPHFFAMASRARDMVQHMASQISTGLSALSSEQATSGS